MSQTDALKNKSEVVVNPYDLHVFVCTNQKPEGKQSCQPKGAEDVLRHLKDWEKSYKERQQTDATGDELKISPPAKRVRVNKSGCLNFCSRGVAVALYPKGEFCLQVEASEPSVGKVIQRLEDLLAGND